MSAELLTRRDRVIIMSSLMLGTLLSALDLLVIATAVPEIASSLGNLSQTAWIFTSYLLGVGVVMPVWGKLGDIYGRAYMYILAIVIFIASSMVAGAAVSMLMLVSARLIQGVAAGGLLALSHAIVGDIAPARSRGIYFACITSVWATAAVLGPLVGGSFVDTIGWRWIFYMNLPIGTIALFFMTGLRRKLNFQRDQAKSKTREVGGLKALARGAALLILGLGILSLAASLVGDIWEVDSIWFIGSILLGFAVMIIFVRSQMKSKEQVIPLEMFNYRAVKAGSLTNFFFGLGNFGLAIIIPLYAQIVNGVSATLAGLSLAPLAIGIFVSTLVVGALVKRSGRYRIYPVLGCAIYILGVLFLLSMDEGSSRPEAMLFAFITGIGNGMLQPIVVLSIQNAVPQKDLGSATSVATTSRSLGQTIGSAVLGAIISASLTSRLTNLGLDPDLYLDSPEEVQNLSSTVSDQVIDAYHSALDYALWGVLAFVFVSMIMSFYIPEESLDVTEESILK